MLAVFTILFAISSIKNVQLVGAVNLPVCQSSTAGCGGGCEMSVQDCPTVTSVRSMVHARSSDLYYGVESDTYADTDLTTSLDATSDLYSGLSARHYNDIAPRSSVSSSSDMFATALASIKTWFSTAIMSNLGLASALDSSTSLSASSDTALSASSDTTISTSLKDVLLGLNGTVDANVLTELLILLDAGLMVQSGGQIGQCIEHHSSSSKKIYHEHTMTSETYTYRPATTWHSSSKMSMVTIAYQGNPSHSTSMSYSPSRIITSVGYSSTYTPVSVSSMTPITSTIHTSSPLLSVSASASLGLSSPISIGLGINATASTNLGSDNGLGLGLGLNTTLNTDLGSDLGLSSKTDLGTTLDSTVSGLGDTTLGTMSDLGTSVGSILRVRMVRRSGSHSLDSNTTSNKSVDTLASAFESSASPTPDTTSDSDSSLGGLGGLSSLDGLGALGGLGTELESMLGSGSSLDGLSSATSDTDSDTILSGLL